MLAASAFLLAVPGAMSIAAEPAAVPPTPSACAGMRFDRVEVGTEGPDSIGPFNGATLMFGLGGDDTLQGGTAADCLSGGDGADVIRGNNGRDRLLGDGGSDRIFGSNGPDVIDGGPDPDLCVGGGGPDTITNCESQSAVDPCDPDGVQVVWDVLPTGVVLSVRVFDVEAACAGKTMSLAVHDASGVLIGRSGRLDAEGDSDLVIDPTVLFVQLPEAPCDPTSCTLQLAPVAGDGSYAGGRGLPGRAIEAVEVAIGAAP